MHSKTVMFIPLVLLLSCSSPMEKKFKPSDWEQDSSTIIKSNQIDTSEMRLMALYIKKNISDISHLKGKTYTEILREAHVSKKTDIIKSEPNQEKRKDIIEMDLEEKSFSSGEWQEYIIFRIICHNQTQKDIRAFKGRVIFTNLFDEEIDSLDFICEQVIPAGKSLNTEIKKEYHPYIEKDKQLKDKRLEDLKIHWITEKIIFTDNSTL